MIAFDIINDEAPLFIEAVKKLPSFVTNKSDFLFVTEGNRWKKEAENLICQNRLNYFDKLDKKNIDIELELDRISSEYDNFNILACDRYLINTDRFFQKKMLVYTYLFFESIFTSNTITHYFTTGIAYTYNLISYQVCKKYKVRHISFYGIRLKNKTAVSFGNTNSFDEVNNLFKTFDKAKITTDMCVFIDNFINRPKQPVYMTNAINSSKLEVVFIKEFFIRFKKYYFSNKHKYDFFTRNPFELSMFKLKKIFNAKKIELNHNKTFDEVSKKDKYFIFPLHMQPEASTLILSPFYLNQKECILNISKILPPNILLYVKEHKSALGQNKIKFYEDLKKYANIKVVSYKENMFDLINNSLGTINLSSTVGLESLILKKPAILLGNAFFNDSGLTFKVDSFKQLENTIALIIRDNFSLQDYFENYDDKLAFYLYCLFEKSYNFEFNVAKLDTKEKVMTEDNINEFSSCLNKIIS